MLKKGKKVLVWIFVIVVTLGLLGSSGIIALFEPPPTLTTRELAFTCTTDMATRFHIHPILSMIVEGKTLELPANIGVTPTCMHPLHTHDNTGMVHVESPEQRDFTLGDFFAVWGKPLSKEQFLTYVATSTHEIVMTVDGKPSEEFENLVLKDKQQIILEYKKIESRK
jgi:hypothetical protein